jgi:hypothetical protein
VTPRDVELDERAVWDTIAAEAAEESGLWAAALRPEHEREAVPVFSPLAPAALTLGLETIYEGYLMHYGRPRLFVADDRDTRILLGDYLYAHGLVRVADVGDVRVVADLAALLSVCAQLRAEVEPGRPVPDGVVWAATLACLGGEGDGSELEAARAELRDRGEPGALADLAVAAAGEGAVEDALVRHAERAAAGTTTIPPR